MRNAGLDEAQAGIKSAGRNINNLRYVDVTTDMAEIKEELKSLLMRKEESEKAGLNSAFRKLRSWHLVPLLHGKIDGETVTDFIFLGSKITADGECSHEFKRRLLLERKVMMNLDNLLKSRDFANIGPSSQSYGLFSSHVWMWATKLLQLCPTLCNPIDGSPPSSPSLGFLRQEHWRGLPFPSPMHESEKWKWSRSVVRQFLLGFQSPSLAGELTPCKLCGVTKKKEPEKLIRKLPEARLKEYRPCTHPNLISNPALEPLLWNSSPNPP